MVDPRYYQFFPLVLPTPEPAATVHFSCPICGGGGLGMQVRVGTIAQCPNKACGAILRVDQVVLSHLCPVEPDPHA